MSQNEIVCPSGFTFVARKFSGRVLAQLSAQENGDLVSGAVAQCCVEVLDPGPYALGDKDGRPNWKRVLTGDLSVAFARLRVLSIPASMGEDPETYLLKVTCGDEACVDPETGRRTTFLWSVRLCEVPVVPLSSDDRALVQKGNVFPGKLPDGRACTYKLPTEEDAPIMRKLMAENGMSMSALAKLPPGQLATVLTPFMVAARVLSLEGTSTVDAARGEVLDLDVWSLNDLAAEISAHDCGFDSFKAICERCKGETEVRLPPLPQLLERPRKVASGLGRSSPGTSTG